jgi:hypothetical protein
MKRLAKIAVAGFLAALIYSPANAVTVAYTGTGTFNLNPPGNNDCNGCSLSGGNTVLDMSGSNNSTLTANTITNSFNLTSPLNNVMIGELTWVNRASSRTDQNFDVLYTFALSFTAPNNSSDSQLFDLNIRQFTNSAGDIVFDLSNATLAGLGPFSLNGVTVSDIHFSLGGGSGGTYNSLTGEWDNPDPSGNQQSRTSTLVITADFAAAVPETSTWAMMILGFAGVGFMAYRRRGQGVAFRIA